MRILIFCLSSFLCTSVSAVNKEACGTPILPQYSARAGQIYSCAPLYDYMTDVTVPPTSLQTALGSKNYRTMITTGYLSGHELFEGRWECAHNWTETQAAYLAALSCDGERALPIIVSLAYQHYDRDANVFLGCGSAQIVLGYADWDADEWCSVERIHQAIVAHCESLMSEEARA